MTRLLLNPTVPGAGAAAPGHPEGVEKGIVFYKNMPWQMEWTDVIDTAGLSTFKPAAELRRILQERGITPDKQVYTH